MATNYTGVYETSMTVRAFRGINQQSGTDNVNPEFAAYAENCDTRGGALAPTRAPLEVFTPLPAPIGTLACFHRRYYASDADRDVLVASAGGVLYARTETDAAWREIGRGYARDDWDYVTYEVNPEGSEAPVDVLLLSNALDGMICIYGNDFRVEPVPTPKKFGVICRHAERIWGSAIDDDPDMLVYSAPYDPFDWEQNTDFPEDGAGDILQPSWDGDRFIALRNWGEYLLAFKHDTVWRVLGTNPGEYVMRQQYGEDGAIAENSIATERDAVFMLYAQGVSVYAGNGTQPLQRDAMRSVFARMNQSAVHGATAICWQHRYLLAVPLDGSETNNAIIEYDTVAGTWMLRTGIEIASFCRYGDRLFCTNPVAPGRTFAMDEGWAQEMRWEMPWQDQTGKNAQKSGFRVFVTVQSDEGAAVKVAIETEKKAKTKTYAAKAGQSNIKRLQIGNRGRRWRLIFSADAGAMWRMTGGVQVDMDIDAD